MTPIDASDLERVIENAHRDDVSGIFIFDTVDSTSSFLLRQVPPNPGMASVAVADHQTAGRGRHDRRWVTQKGASLCLSMAYTFATLPATLLGLTPVMGVAVHRALRASGLDDLKLKWPNDLVVRDSKLGGLLAETQLKGDRSVTVVAGVGINLDLPHDLLESSGSAWAHRAIDLKSAMSSQSQSPSPPTRDELAAAIVAELLRAFRAFESGELAAMLAEWRELDWLLGKDIVVDEGKHSVSGIAAGIGEEGALLLQTGSGIEHIISGSIRVEDPYSS